MKKEIYILMLLFFTLSCKDKEIELTEIQLINAPETPSLGKFKIPDDNPTTQAGVELGRMLFYEKKLSGDNTMSCATCHIQEFAFSDGQATSKGIDGIAGRRNSMALVNLLWDEVFFWEGRVSSLEEQALRPIEDPIELHQSLENTIVKLEDTKEYPKKFKDAFGSKEITAERIAKAIAQFERTLVSANSKFDKFLRGEVDLTEQELRGFNTFSTHPIPGQVRGGNCGDCHLGYNFSNKELINNGLSKIVGLDKGLEEITGKASDRGKFKVPTLRNIALTAPYMHDGRFKTLEEVLDHYNNPDIFSHENVGFDILNGTNEPDGTSLLLTEQEKADIIAFLKTLTDESFITNEKFSNPF